jgi:DNA modification methylase
MMNKFFSIPLDRVVINRERFRDATGDMEGLAASLLKFGQLQPIVLDSNNELLAGFRRFTAAGMNGWTEIVATRKDDVDELLAREIELEENIQRENMSWVEEQRAIAEIDRIRRMRDPNWNQAKTAQVINPNMGQNRVSEAVQLTKAMELFPELKTAKNKNQAMSWLKQKASLVVRTAEVKNNNETYVDVSEKIVLGDSVEVIKTIPDESFHAVITDPPFGIDYGDRKAGTESTLTAYEDGQESYERLLTMAPDLYRVIKPNGWLVWFFGISWYGDELPDNFPEANGLRSLAEGLRTGRVSPLQAADVIDSVADKIGKIKKGVKRAFRDAGFTVDEIPIIWDRSEGKCHTNRPDHYFPRAYDVALHAFKGDPQIIKRNLPNVIRIKPVGTNERELMVERPIELYAELIQRLTVPGEQVADFFVGSGSCPAACAATGRNYYGVEQNPERRAVAIQKIKAHTPDSTKAA